MDLLATNPQTPPPNATGAPAVSPVTPPPVPPVPPPASPAASSTPPPAPGMPVDGPPSVEPTPTPVVTPTPVPVPVPDLPPLAPAATDDTVASTKPTADPVGPVAGPAAAPTTTPAPAPVPASSTPNQAPTRPTIDDILNKDILELLGATGLPQDQKGELYQRMLGILQNRVIVRIDDLLDPADVDGWKAAIDTGDMTKMQAFLESKQIDFPQLLVEEAVLLKSELVDLASPLRQQLTQPADTDADAK